MMSRIALPFGIAAMMCPIASQAQPGGLTQTFEVPAHIALCAQSQPFSVTPDADPEFGNIVFQVLYNRIQQAAMEGGLTSTGVPYVASSTENPPPPPAPPPGNAPAPPGQPAPPTPPPSTYTVRVCAVVAAAPATPPAGLQVEQIPAQRVYGVRCDARYVDDCKESVASAMRVTGLTVGSADDLTWWLRQALTTGDDPADLARAFVDHELRPLAPDARSPDAPAVFVVVAANVPS